MNHANHLLGIPKTRPPLKICQSSASETGTTDSGALARYSLTFANGSAVQAAGGASRDELRQVAKLAVAGW